MEQIERLRALANEGLEEYQSALQAGGEPAYPQWADDILAVCELAAVGAQFQRVPALRRPAGGYRPRPQ